MEQQLRDAPEDASLLRQQTALRAALDRLGGTTISLADTPLTIGGTAATYDLVMAVARAARMNTHGAAATTRGSDAMSLVSLRS